MKLLLIQGANMEYLGIRQPELYGTTTAAELDVLLTKRAAELGVELDIRYTNIEGEAISAMYAADRAGIDGILFNPAGFLHSGYAFRDCLRSIRAPALEIHMTNIEKRGYGSERVVSGSSIPCSRHAPGTGATRVSFKNPNWRSNSRPIPENIELNKTVMATTPGATNCT